MLINWQFVNICFNLAEKKVWVFLVVLDFYCFLFKKSQIILTMFTLIKAIKGWNIKVGEHFLSALYRVSDCPHNKESDFYFSLFWCPLTPHCWEESGWTLGGSGAPTDWNLVTSTQQRYLWNFSWHRKKKNILTDSSALCWSLNLFMML